MHQVKAYGPIYVFIGEISDLAREYAHRASYPVLEGHTCPSVCASMLVNLCTLAMCTAIYESYPLDGKPGKLDTHLDSIIGTRAIQEKVHVCENTLA